MFLPPIHLILPVQILFCLVSILSHPLSKKKKKIIRLFEWYRRSTTSRSRWKTSFVRRYQRTLIQATHYLFGLPMSIASVYVSSRRTRTRDSNDLEFLSGRSYNDRKLLLLRYLSLPPPPPLARIVRRRAIRDICISLIAMSIFSWIREQNSYITGITLEI